MLALRTQATRGCGVRALHPSPHILIPIPAPDIDKETFEVMWALSAPGGAAEKCFLRQPQTELFDDSEPRPFLQGLMPGVSTRYFAHHSDISVLPPSSDIYPLAHCPPGRPPAPPS
jgi:hypothetical protein